MVVQRLVRDAPGDRDQFAHVVHAESEEEITGPTLALRVALRLARAGIALPAGQAADPWGKVAAERLLAIETWTSGYRARDYLDQLRQAGQ